MNDINYPIYFLSIVLFGLLFYFIFWKAQRYGRIIIPEKFTLRKEDVSDIIKTLRKIMLCFSGTITLDMKNVKLLTHESYMVLMAQVEKTFLKTKGKTIQLTNIPINKKIINIITGDNSNHTTKHKYIDLKKNRKSDFLNNALFEPSLIIDIERELIKMGIRDYYELNTMITEILGNAIEHGIKNENINWWMYYYRDKVNKKMTFAFVDMGTGIISSYKKSRVIKLYDYWNNKKIIKNAINGKLGSSTKEPNRGRGLPQFKRMVEKNWISDFVLITNTVSLRYINNGFDVTCHPNFIGTYYYWTVSKENYLQWKKQSI